MASPPGRGRAKCDVAVNTDCRHYVMQTTPRREKLERCKVDANEHLPFACPEGCLFYEPRRTSAAGWHVGHEERGDPGTTGR